uniref:Uncharacterized protein n=1 Tax=Rhizophora mucronata TaxID=61149 RepID=A0A2P2NZC4_RHIMU
MAITAFCLQESWKYRISRACNAQNCRTRAKKIRGMCLIVQCVCYSFNVG